MASTSKKSALFVCLGNICRSPTAEAVLHHLVAQRGIADQVDIRSAHHRWVDFYRTMWDIDSAGTIDYHFGSHPDKRAVACMKKHGVAMEHRARQLTPDDFYKFQYIFGMDEDNISDIKRMAPKSHTAKIEMLGQYDPEQQLTIRDPYYDMGDKGFEEIYVQCTRCCQAFLDKISNE